MKRITRPAAVLAACATVVAAAGCGGGGGNENADPASVAPAGTVLYLTGTVRPEGSQKDALNSIAGKVLHTSDPAAKIKQLIDQSGTHKNLTYDKDVKPWLGKQAAFEATELGSGGSGGTHAVIVAAKDTGKAKDFIKNTKDKTDTDQNYKGVDYVLNTAGDNAVGVVKDFVVIGNQAGFKSVVDASEGDNLSDTEIYKSAADKGKDKLGFAFIDIKGLVGSLANSGRLPADQAQGLNAVLSTANVGPVIATADARPNALLVDLLAKQVGSLSAGGGAASLVGALPSGSWLGLGIPHFGQSIAKALQSFAGGAIGATVVAALRNQLKSRTGLDLDNDIIGALGDISFFAEGTSVLTAGGGAIVATPDPAAAKQFLTKVAALAERYSHGKVKVHPATIDGVQGISATVQGLPGTVNGVVKGHKMVIAYGDNATHDALHPSGPLSASPEFQAAQKSLEGVPLSAYVGIQPIISLMESSGKTMSPQAKQYLSALSTLAVGGKSENGSGLARLVLAFK